ncbi:alpha/beta fold hydrolase [uncultured Pseudokineococcus sp.]|uniref:alpha/beta fold hydrolase n=1 Tax=uncultured Pseudokineococcus sp. TaxID=1642928 RepID=UPI00262F133B|nr:alpha/beta hydrolase [uncultured Pseudokineococcus sp.]
MPKLLVSRDDRTDVEISYEDLGTGRPVVLVHGWPLSGRSWEAQVPALVGAGYRVITYDRRGFGDSSRPWHGYDYDTLAADLHALLEHLDVRDAALVGFSMGGGEVVRYLARHGTERASREVLASAVPPYLHATDDNPDGGLDDATIDQFQQGVASDRPDFLETFTERFFTADGRVVVSEAQRRATWDEAVRASPKATYDCIATFGLTDLRDDVRAVTVPTLVIHGDSDAVVPFEVSGRRSAEMVEGCELVVVEGGPHGVNVSHARQFNAALLDFLGGRTTAARD